MRVENYAAGLVEELRGYTAAKMVDRAKEVRAELEGIAADLPMAIARAETDFTAGIKIYGNPPPELVRQTMAAQPEVQRLRRLEADLTELGYFGAPRKRTAKATTPPNLDPNAGGGAGGGAGE